MSKAAVTVSGKADRVKQLRSTLGLSMENFGSRIGVGKSAVNQWEKGVNDITEQVCKSICREYGVSSDWLRHGVGDMFVPKCVDDVISIKDCSEMEKRFLHAYLELDSSSRGQIMEFFSKVFA